MFQQQAGEKKMSEMVRAKSAFEPILGRSISIEARARVIDENVHMVKAISNRRRQPSDIALYRKVGFDKLRASVWHLPIHPVDDLRATARVPPHQNEGGIWLGQT